MPQERSQDSQDSLEQGREDNSPSGHVYEIVRPRPYSPANGAYYDSLSDVSDSSTDSSAGGAALHPESWPTSNGNSESHHITDEEDDERKAPSAVSGSPPRSSQTSFRSNIDKRPYLMEGSGELSDDALSEPEHPQRSFATFVENAEDEEDLSPWKIFESDKLPTDDFRQEGSSMSSRMTKRVSASNFSSLPDISIHKRPHGFSYGSEKGKHIANPLVSSYSIPPSSRMASRGSTNSNFSASAEMLPGERPYHARHRGPKGKGIATSSASTNTLSWSSWTSDGETKPRMRRRTRKYRDQEVRGTRTPSPDTSQRTRLRKRFDHRRSTKRSSHQSSYGDNGFSNGQPVYGNYSDEANPSFYSASRHQDRQYGATGQGYWGNGALGSSYPPYNRNNYFSGSPYTRAPYPSHFGGAYTPHQYPDPIYPQYPPMNSRPWSTLPTTQPDIELAPGKKINTERADAPSPLVDDQNEKSAHATSSMGLYKPPISCDSAAHEMSVEVSLKSSHPDPIVQETLIASIHSAAKKEIQTVWVNEKSTNVLPRGGISSLTSAMAIEHYADGLGQDKINMITAHPVSSPFATNQMETMQWLTLWPPVASWM
ncbi:hypothetical protein F4778DRAFT_524098 [Xylariomycetidae sp. FL2044]|nr:hypothetical protein F4778DRAFT_524098 [Xylariomycetidae sp. FL2044]